MTLDTSQFEYISRNGIGLTRVSTVVIYSFVGDIGFFRYKLRKIELLMGLHISDLYRASLGMRDHTVLPSCHPSFQVLQFQRPKQLGLLQGPQNNGREETVKR